MNLKNILRKIKSKFMHLQWRIYFSTEKNFMLQSYHQMKPPANAFWADPFLIHYKDQHFIFFEELNFSDYKGYICVSEIFENGKYSKPIKVLEQNYHLSYPFVFEKDGCFYMIPESHQNKTIDLYKSTDFPYKWTHVRTLISDIEASDSTLLSYQNKFWLFTSIKKSNSEDWKEWNELHLFFADRLDGQWTAHPQNPINTDLATSRMGGRITKSDNKLIRPAQNCLQRYGHKISMLEILTLSETTYKEHLIETISSTQKNILGIHHTDSTEKFRVLDGEKYCSRIF